ncbi:DUF3027 domain-containing protein [Saccharopolyspora sp. SCSIO 74807]|uniref:DUF3027 domain-containing protein n=1 Tax=Saccharopolyspora sp. SCSIO 74807 TaxID=3118084 RepID=UPI0030CAC48C
MPQALIGLLALVLALVLRWYVRRARANARQQRQDHTGQVAAQRSAAGENSGSHPESLTRAAGTPSAYGTIEHVTPMPAPTTDPDPLGFRGEPSGEPAADRLDPAPLDPAPLDPALAAAVDTARAAAEEEAAPATGPIGSPVLTVDDAEDAPVGAHVGVEPEGDGVATHYFESNYPGYVGWRWAVTVALAAPDEPVTVSEVVLLPGQDALTAPAWVPWHDRVRPGDLGAGDLMPSSPEDPRLAPGYLSGGDQAVQDLAHEVGLGRTRVLSDEGRLAAAERWLAGDFGPGSETAKMAPGACGTCGFFLSLAGPLQAAFGVCGNEIAPADGRVVHVEFGCGAHSEAEVDTSSTVPVAEVVYDDTTLDFESRG